MALLSYFLSFLLLNAAHCLYIDDSYPWLPGHLTTAEYVIEPEEGNPDTIPMHTMNYYPTNAGDALATVYFIGGFDGIFPPEMYGDLMHNIASHGYVISATWPLQGVDGFNMSTTAHFANLDWLKANLAGLIEAIPDWDLMSYSCHSGGCGTTYSMTDEQPALVASNVFFEPVSPDIHEGTYYGGPAIMEGALLATGRCSLEIYDHEVYYDYWECPRILMEAEEFGHCDLLNDAAWQACNITGFCETGPEDRLDEYRMFVQGMGSAFMNAYVQGSMHYLDYLLVEEDIPIKLSMYETDVEC